MRRQRLWWVRLLSFTSPGRRALQLADGRDLEAGQSQESLRSPAHASEYARKRSTGLRRGSLHRLGQAVLQARWTLAALAAGHSQLKRERAVSYL